VEFVKRPSSREQSPYRPHPRKNINGKWAAKLNLDVA